MRRRSKFGKAFMILICVAVFISLFSLIVMSLWNAILPNVLHVTNITFWQAMGILVLSKILFGGFGGWGNKNHKFKQKMHEKWHGMNEAEREEFRASMRARWKGWCQPAREDRSFRDHFFRDKSGVKEEPGVKGESGAE